MQIVLIAHDIRSCHNVGSLLRTAEGFGVHHVYLTGYTPYPQVPTDERLPHISRKITSQINKTALGAETAVPWSHQTDVVALLNSLRSSYQLVGLEQCADSEPLASFSTDQNIALVIGREVEGIAPEILALLDRTVEIPMVGHKESFNVVQATAVALYHCQYFALPKSS